MKTRHNSAIWLGIAFVISACVLLSAVSSLGGESVAELTTAGFVIQALPIVLGLYGTGIIIYTVFKFSRPVNDSTNFQHFELADYEEGSTMGSAGMASAGIQVTSADNDTTLQVDEMDFDNLDPDSQFDKQLEIDKSSHITSSANPVVEAKVLANFGKSNQAIELLLSYFDLHGANYDEIALELVAIFENEINKEDVSAERLDYLYDQRNKFVFKLEDDRTKLSKSTWAYIQQYYVGEIESKLVNPSGEFQRTGTRDIVGV